MSIDKLFEDLSKNLRLLNSDMQSMFGNEKPQEASRKSLEPSVSLSKEGEGPPKDPDSMSKSEFIHDYYKKRMRDIL